MKTFFKCLVFPSKRRAAKRLRNMSIKCGDIERAIIFSRLGFQKLKFEDRLKILIKNMEDENIVRASKTIKRAPEVERGRLKHLCSDYFFKKYEHFLEKGHQKEADKNIKRADLVLNVP